MDIEIVGGIRIGARTVLQCISGKDGIYEVRIREAGNSFRVFCFFDGNIIVVGHGFQKKSQKLPDREIKKARIIKKLYEKERKAKKSG